MAKRGLDLSFLSEEEMECIVVVIQKDFELRAFERNRIRRLEKRIRASKIKRTLLGDTNKSFNETFCIICYNKFIFLIRPKHICGACKRNVCGKCSLFASKFDTRICSNCQKETGYSAMSCDWFYESVAKKFRSNGSEKIVKRLCDVKAKRTPLSVLSSNHDDRSSLDSPCSVPGISGDMVSPEILDRVKEAQIQKFRNNVDQLTLKLKDELRSSLPSDMEGLAKKYREEIKSVMKDFSHVLYITIENHNSQTDHDESDAYKVAAELLRQEVENIVGDSLDVPIDDSMSLASEEDSVVGGDRCDFEDKLTGTLLDKFFSDHELYLESQAMTDGNHETDLAIAALEETLVPHDSSMSMVAVVDTRQNVLSQPEIYVHDEEDLITDEYLFNLQRTLEAKTKSGIPLPFDNDSTPRGTDPDLVSLAGVSDATPDIRTKEQEEELSDEEEITADEEDNSDRSRNKGLGSSWLMKSLNPLDSFKSLEVDSTRSPSPMIGEREVEDMVDDSLSDEEFESTFNAALSRSHSFGLNDAYARNLPFSRRPIRRRHSSHTKKASRRQVMQPEENSSPRDSGITCSTMADQRSFFSTTNSSLSTEKLDIPDVDATLGLKTEWTSDETSDPRFVTPPKEVTVPDGEIAEVEVEVTGTQPIDIYWYRVTRKTLVQLEESEKIEIHVISPVKASLSIWNMEASDAGEYLAMAVNELHTSSQAFKLQVEENSNPFKRPEFNTSMSDMEVVIGTTAEFRCRVGGYPVPRVFFLKEGKKLKSNDSKYIMRKNGNRTHTLEIIDVTAEDDAEYSCRVSNRLGHCQCDAQLLVKKPEKRISSPRLSPHTSDVQRPGHVHAMVNQVQARGVNMQPSEKRMFDIGSTEESVSAAMINKPRVTITREPDTTSKKKVSLPDPMQFLDRLKNKKDTAGTKDVKPSDRRRKTSPVEIEVANDAITEIEVTNDPNTEIVIIPSRRDVSVESQPQEEVKEEDKMIEVKKPVVIIQREKDQPSGEVQVKTVPFSETTTQQTNAGKRPTGDSIKTSDGFEGKTIKIKSSELSPEIPLVKVTAPESQSEKVNEENRDIKNGSYKYDEKDGKLSTRQGSVEMTNGEKDAKLVDDSSHSLKDLMAKFNQPDTSHVMLKRESSITNRTCVRVQKVSPRESSSSDLRDDPPKSPLPQTTRVELPSDQQTNTTQNKSRSRDTSPKKEEVKTSTPPSKVSLLAPTNNGDLTNKRSTASLQRPTSSNQGSALKAQSSASLPRDFGSPAGDKDGAPALLFGVKLRSTGIDLREPNQQD